MRFFCILTWLFTKILLTSQHKIEDGQVIFVNSMSGHRVAGGSKFYSATKFAVTALLEGWRMEVQRLQYNVT